MLKVGKIPDNVLKRSVIRQIACNNEDILTGPVIGGDYSALRLDNNEILVSSINSVVELKTDRISYAVYSAVNNIIISGADPVGIMVSILLPDNSNEDELKTIMSRIKDACDIYNISVAGGHTEVSAAVTKPVITVTAVGKISDEKQIIKTGAAQVGDDLVLTKWIGLEGTSLIANNKEEELKERFSQAFVDRAIDFDKLIPVTKEVSIISSLNISTIHDVSKGGIFGALWELAEGAKVGLTIDLMAIPVKQETVEICEQYGVNPYELISGGALLISSQNGHDVVRELSQNGINAAVIGKVTDSNDRVILNGDEKRFIYRPSSDEINHYI